MKTTPRISLAILSLATTATVGLAQEGWSGAPGQGLGFDAGSAFSFHMLNQLQAHWGYTSNEDAVDTNSFSIRRARTTFSGTVFNKSIAYMLQLDNADTAASIKKGHVQWTMQQSDDGSIGLRMGQGKTLFGLAATQSSQGLFFVERAAAVRGFADGYSRGAWVLGKHVDNKLRWSVGAMNADVAGGLGSNYLERGEETGNADSELSFTGMVNFDPLGDTFAGSDLESGREGDLRSDSRELQGTIGLGLALGNGRAPGGVDIESTSVNLNTAWSVNSFQLMGEYFMRTDDPQTAAADEEEPSGWYLSGTYLMPKTGNSPIQWGYGVRIGQVETDEGASGSGVTYLTGLQGIGSTLGDATEISLVADAFYHGHACKTQFEYTLQDVDMGAGGSATNHILRIAFQLLF